MKNKNGQAYLFLTPFLALVTIFYVIPALLTIIMSFTSLNASFIWKFNGLDNFRRIFADPNTPKIVLNTLLFVGISIIATVIIDLALAILSTYFVKNESWSSFFKSLLMIPMITPAVVYSVLWIWLLEANENGLVNKLYLSVTRSEFPINWIAQYPFQIIVLATIVSGLAYGAIIFSSAIKSIPENQFKAARIDGANEWEIVKSIIIPNIKYHVQFIALWETLGLLTNYVTILLITNGGPGIQTEVWALSAYHKAFVDQQYGYGAAISLILILVVLLVMIGINKLMQSRNAGGRA